MGFLLDTDVISELRKERPHPRVVAWWDAHRREDLFISALVVGEVRQGIVQLRARNDPAQADALESWLGELERDYAESVLPVTAEVAEVWGRLNAATDRPPVIEGLMAATAIVHRLTFATRNVRDIGRTGVAWTDPFE
jgi:predicted nucleic acid-binding protein